MKLLQNMKVLTRTVVSNRFGKDIFGKKSHMKTRDSGF